jgi:hypothetical protein
VPQLRIPPHHQNCRKLGHISRSYRKTGPAFQRGLISRGINSRPQVRSPDKIGIPDRRHNTECHGFLLLCLSACRARPARNQGVDAVSTDGEDEYGEVVTDGILRQASCDTINCGDDLGDDDVPRPLIEFPRRARHGDDNNTSIELRKTSQD